MATSIKGECGNCRDGSFALRWKKAAALWLCPACWPKWPFRR